MEKLNVIGEELDDWVVINTLNLDAKILDKVQVICCDTGDFTITWGSNVPDDKLCIVSSNKFLQYTKEGKCKYTINKKDILRWLDKLCEIAGRYGYSWIFLPANLKKRINWDIRYISFVRNNKNPEEFIVCDHYFRPIEYREIIKNLNKEELNLMK